jgi:hypothetical protein
MLRDGLEYLRLAPAGFDAEVTQNVVMWGLPPVERLIETAFIKYGLGLSNSLRDLRDRYTRVTTEDNTSSAFDGPTRAVAYRISSSRYLT